MSIPIPAAVLVKFHDPRVGRIHAIQETGANGVEAVDIRLISAKFFAPQGVTDKGKRVAMLLTGP